MAKRVGPEEVLVIFEDGYGPLDHPLGDPILRQRFEANGWVSQQHADRVEWYPPHAIRSVTIRQVVEDASCTFLWSPIGGVCGKSGMDHQCAGRERGHNMADDRLAALHKCGCGAQYDVNAFGPERRVEPGPRIIITCPYEWGSDCIEATGSDHYDPQRKHACVDPKEMHLGLVHHCRCGKTRGVTPEAPARPILRRGDRT